MKLMVEIDGQTVALNDCHWVLFDQDGCAFGSIHGDTALNAEAAHREFAPLKRHREKQIREGYVVRLVSGSQWKAQAEACFFGKCDHVKQAAS